MKSLGRRNRQTVPKLNTKYMIPKKNLSQTSLEWVFLFWESLWEEDASWRHKHHGNICKPHCWQRLGIQNIHRMLRIQRQVIQWAKDVARRLPAEAGQWLEEWPALSVTTEIPSETTTRYTTTLGVKGIKLSMSQMRARLWRSWVIPMWLWEGKMAQLDSFS